MTTPEIPDSHKALLDAQIAVLGTIGASGRPQLSDQPGDMRMVVTLKPTRVVTWG
jgi:hypothetical protein